MATLPPMSFIATLCYELHPGTELEAAQLFRAEMVGRRWQDRHHGEKLPATALWMARSAEAGQTTDDVHAACADDVYKAAATVAAMGRKIAVLRAWIQVTGAGTYGLVAGVRPRPEAPRGAGPR